MAAPKNEDKKIEEKDDLGGFDEAEEKPEVKKSEVKKVKAPPGPQPFVVKKNDNLFEGPNKHLTERLDPADPEKKKLLPAQVGAYVNQHGVAFPAGFKFKGGHIGYKGNVVLVKCPKCGHRNAPSEAIKGECSNVRANEGNGCGFSAVAELEDVESA